MQRTVKIKDVAMACFDFFVSIFDFSLILQTIYRIFASKLHHVIKMYYDIY